MHGRDRQMLANAELTNRMGEMGGIYETNRSVGADKRLAFHLPGVYHGSCVCESVDDFIRAINFSWIVRCAIS